jgi:hypothetical protein
MGQAKFGVVPSAGPNTVIVTARITPRNVVAFKLARLAQYLFGDRGFVWCLNHLFEGKIWARPALKEK